MESKTTEYSYDTMTFWSILDDLDCDICIPLIQRDYAQGRNDDATRGIREEFLEDIFNAIINSNGSKLDINFIYGNIEASDGRRKFVPIDGQQRLTTLYLLHLYFAIYSGQIEDDEIKSKLHRFHYETRSTTDRFCEQLVESANKLKVIYSKKISDQIRDFYWFFQEFNNDPSISGMLVMLDSIDNKAKSYLDEGTNLDNVFDELVSKNCPITFRFYNLDDSGLTESIYIKMNARGKSLSDFENFKARLDPYLESQDKEFADEFISAINGRWSDFFWHKEYRRQIDKDEYEPVFDMQILRFFRFCILMKYIVSIDNSKVPTDRNIIRNLMTTLTGEQDFVFIDRVFKDGFRKVDSFDAGKKVIDINAFKAIGRILDILYIRKQETGTIEFADKKAFSKEFINEEESFRGLIGASDRRFELDDQILLYAEYAFLLKNASDDGTFEKGEELQDWLHIVYDVTKYRSSINLQMDDMFRIIRSLHHLLMDMEDEECKSYIGKQLYPDIWEKRFNGLSKRQCEEESIKAILIQRDEKWKRLIEDSENTFMDGQTGILYDFSGLTNEYEHEIKRQRREAPLAHQLYDNSMLLKDVDSSSEFYHCFENYLTKFKTIFDAEGIRKELVDNEVFRRALLCYGEDKCYMLSNGDRLSFLSDTGRDFSFKRYLHDDNHGKRAILKQLLDDIDLESQENIVEQLQNIIDQKVFGRKDRWKEYFVKIPEIITCIDSKEYKGNKDPDEQYVFINPQRFIRKRNSDDIVLISRTRMYSYHRELYSYVLFLKARKMGLPLHYSAQKVEADSGYAYYMDKSGTKKLIRYNKGKYNLIKNGNIEMMISDMEASLEYIQKDIALND